MDSYIQVKEFEQEKKAPEPCEQNVNDDYMRDQSGYQLI